MGLSEHLEEDSYASKLRILPQVLRKVLEVQRLKSN